MTDIQLYNSLTKSKETFQPIDPDNVTLYACGPTVYNYIHVGNGRMCVVFDLLYRVLKEHFPKVTYARNITDIDDKIMNASKETGQSCEEISTFYDQAFQDDTKAINCLEPDVQPHATEYVDQMIAMIERMIEHDHAYAAEGHVLFHVPSYDDYGKLSNRSRDEQIAGARVDVAPYKKDPADFVLWKPSTDDQPGWDSPWGRGRPGWHIECSAMSTDILGETFDIHAGGLDLKFPHHENEIAQSCCANKGSNFAKLWMHNGYLNVDGEKMSKSLGNFHTVHDVLEKYPGEAIRFLLLSAHYRQPLDFSFKQLDEAKAILDRWYRALSKVDGFNFDGEHAIHNEVLASLADDLNTPKAFTVLHDLVSRLNKAEGDEALNLAGSVLASARYMGLLQADPQTWLQSDDVDADWVDSQIQARNAAKTNKDFAQADQIRDDLLEQGIVLEDGSEGTTWRKK